MHPAVVVALVLSSLIVSVVLGTLAFVLGAHARYRKLDGENASDEPLWRYAARETWALLRLMAFIVTPSARGFAGRGGGRPVVCVHGFIGNHSNFDLLRKKLHAKGRPTLSAALGRPPRPIEDYAPPLLEALERAVRASPDGKVDVVAHSMGGLVLRYCLTHYDGVQERLGRVVALGSPFSGTRSVPDFLIHEGKQMATGSDWLASLSPVETPETWTTVAAHRDYIVFPEDSSALEGVEHHVVDRVGHAGLLVADRVHALVLDALTR